MARAPRQSPARQSPASRQYKGVLDKIRVYERQPFVREGEIEGRSDDVLGLLRTRVRAEIVRQQAADTGKRADNRMPNFTVPSPRKVRPMTEDGRTSFHFSHEGVSKTMRQVEKKSGLRNAPGAAGAHGKYIERQNAVAELEGDGAELPAASEAAAAEAIASVRNPDAETTLPDPEGLADSHGRYVERQEALAERADGTKVLFTNISDDAAERMEVWAKIEKMEANPKDDHVSIMELGANFAFWAAVQQKEDCPPELADAIVHASPQGAFKFKVKDGTALRHWLTEQPGWKKDEPQAKFHDARGGRVQYRIIGELPHDITTAERSSILKEFTKEFEKHKLPYVAVMHEPDHTNDSRNWHFHLIYYDRPIAKMEDGRWDFEAKETIVRSNRMKRDTYPHRQDKLREVNDRKWVPNLRKRLADITNDHLERANIERRLDPRRYSEMGIHREAQEHLGTRLSAMEAMGVATPKGFDNANKEWDALMDQVARLKEVGDRKTEMRIDKWMDKSAKAFPDESERRDIRVQIDRWRQDQEQANELRFYAETVQRHHERLISKAQKTVEACRKKLDAIDRGEVKPSERSRGGLLSRREQEALDYIEKTGNHFNEELRLAAGWSKRAAFLQQSADERATLLDDRIGAGRDEVLEKATRSGREEDRAERLAKERARAEGQQRRALTKGEMDAWIDAIRSDHRRLKREGRKVVPARMTEADRDVVAALNYSQMGERLGGIKRQQDKLIEDVVGYIAKNPRSVIETKRPDGRSDYTLRVPRPQWASGFAAYKDEPELQAAIAIAMADPRRQGARVEPARDRPADALAETVARTVETAAPAPETVRAGATPEVINQAIGRLSSEPIRIRFVKGHLEPDAKSLETLGVTVSDLSSPSVQQRLKGIRQEQDRETRRIEAYARSRPRSFTEVEGFIVIQKTAPKDLVVIADKWRTDPEMQATLRDIVNPKAKTDAGGRDKDAERRERDLFAAETQASEQPKPAERVRTAAEIAAEERAAAIARVTKPKAVKPAPIERPAAPAAKPEPVAPDRPKAPAGGGARQLSMEEMLQTQGRFPKDGRGVNPKIDNWVNAQEAQREERLRHKLAAAVLADKQAVKDLDRIDPVMAERIRREADAYRRSQQIGRGQERDGPER